MRATHESNGMARAGAIFFLLWGLAHVAGGGLLLVQLGAEGPVSALRGLNSTLGQLELDPALAPALGGLLGFHLFNILILGLAVSLCALTLNWRNRRAGFWLALGLAGAADLGLFLFQLRPGLIPWGEGSIGLGLLALAVPFSWAGLRQGVRP